MSACVVLEDGRVLWRSTVVMSGVYRLIALAVSHEHTRFKRWLADMSDRPAPFMDFDLRGLPDECRVEFHRAARIARDRLAAEVNTGRIPADAVEPFDKLVRMKESIDRGDPPLTLSDDSKVHIEISGFNDLDQIWSDDDGGSAVA